MATVTISDSSKVAFIKIEKKFFALLYAMSSTI